MNNGDVDSSVVATAINNLVAAICSQLLTTDSQSVSVFLGILESMNDGLIPASSFRDSLKAGTDMQRNLLAAIKG